MSEAPAAHLLDLATYEAALEETIDLMDHLPHPGTPDAQRLESLLDQIARFQTQVAADPARAPAPQAGSAMIELEGRIARMARTWRQEHPDGDRHWEPMLGGDLRSDQATGRGH